MSPGSSSAQSSRIPRAKYVRRSLFTGGCKRGGPGALCANWSGGHTSLHEVPPGALLPRLLSRASLHSQHGCALAALHEGGLWALWALKKGCGLWESGTAGAGGPGSRRGDPHRDEGPATCGPCCGGPCLHLRVTAVLSKSPVSSPIGVWCQVCKNSRSLRGSSQCAPPPVAPSASPRRAASHPAVRADPPERAPRWLRAAQPAAP